VFDPNDDSKVYASTFTDGIWRFDYHPDAANILTNGTRVFNPPANGGIRGSLGLAIHNDTSIGESVMYLAPAVPFAGLSGTLILETQSIIRLTDSNGDGTWGGTGDLNQAVIDNISVNQHHQVNQLQLLGDTLYVAIGTKTDEGGVLLPNPGETARNGTICFIEDLSQLSTTATNPAGFTYTDLNGDSVVNDLDVRADTQAFTSNDPAKLRVFSTGQRNCYGLGISPTGEIWVAQNTDGGLEDEVGRVFYQADRGFPKINHLVGDWRVDGDHDASLGSVDPSQIAIAAGFFNPSNLTEIHAELGLNTSANGMDFLTNTTDPTLEGDILITRWAPATGPSSNDGDIIHVDSETGATTPITNISGGVPGLLDCKRDPFGNYLVADMDGSFSQIRVDSVIQGGGVAMISNVPVAEDGTAFAVGAQAFYNENANIIGGSASATIPTFNNLVFFDTTGLTTDSGDAVGAGDIIGGSLAFTVNNTGGGEHSGDVEVHYLGSFATIPIQNGGNNSESDQELLALAQTAGTLLFSGPLAVDESETLDLAGFVDNNSPILVFRFTDPSPAPTANQQSGIRIDNLDLLVAGGSLTGDFNGDGVVDCLDIDEYIGLVGTSVAGNPEFDLVADGTIDSADVAFLTENLVVTSNGETGTFLGDLNCDGSVDVLGDALILIANLGSSVNSYALGDVNLSGTVSVLGDALVLVANLGLSNNQ